MPTKLLEMRRPLCVSVMVMPLAASAPRVDLRHRRIIMRLIAMVYAEYTPFT